MLLLVFSLDFGLKLRRWLNHFYLKFYIYLFIFQILPRKLAIYQIKNVYTFNKFCNKKKQETIVYLIVKYIYIFWLIFCLILNLHNEVLRPNTKFFYYYKKRCLFLAFEFFFYMILYSDQICPFWLLTEYNVSNHFVPEYQMAFSSFSKNQR